MCLCVYCVLKHELNDKFVFYVLRQGGSNSEIPSDVIAANLVRFFNWAVQISD